MVRSLTSSSSVGLVQPAVVGDAEPAQRRAGALREQLPRHDVGVVLHLGDHDLVAGPEARTAGRRAGCAEGVRHQVDRLGGVLGEHHLVAEPALMNAATFSRAPS